MDHQESLGEQRDKIVLSCWLCWFSMGLHRNYKMGGNGLGAKLQVVVASRPYGSLPLQK